MFIIFLLIQKPWAETDNNNTSHDIVNRYHITDTLPLTAVKVNKKWEDSSDKYGLRPTDIVDKNKGETAAANTYAINLTLSKKTSGNYPAESTLADTSVFVGTTETETTDKINSNYKNWYVSEKNASTDTWTYTYKKLLKYDESNTAYTFKITEAQVPGYKTPTYKRDSNDNSNDGQIVDDVDTGSTWDGTATLAEEFYIQNELDTRNITVTKSWNDNGYGGTPNNATAGNLHYDVKVTLHNDKIENDSNPAAKVIQKSVTSGETTTYTNGYGVVFEGLPKYDKDGNVLTYTVNETVAVSGDPEPAGESNQNATNGTAVTSGFSQTDTKYGYVGSCKQITATDSGINKAYVTQYNITNTLPVSKFTVNKTWSDDKNRDGYRPDSLGFTLTRSVNSTNDTNFSASGNATTTNWSTTFSNGVFLTYNESGTSYNYTITENDFTHKDKYTTTSTVGTPSTDENHVTTRIDSFTNTHVSKKKGLTLEKKWVDTISGTDYSSTTRPANVSVKLKIKYASQDAKEYAQLTADEQNALGLSSDYQGAIKIDGDKTGDGGKTWTKVLSDLPVNINPTGTETSNGHSYPVEYSIEEVNHYGYTDTYSSAVQLDTDNKKLTVTNTLKTQKIKVIKEWDDHITNSTTEDYSGTDYNHFNITVKVTSTDMPGMNDKTFTINKTTDRGSNSTDFIEIEVPIYKYVAATGSEVEKIEQAHYTIEELDALSLNGMPYGYEKKTFKYSDIVVNEETVQEYKFTNKLPLTSVTVTKTWSDNSDSNHLRADKINLKLFRTTDSTLARTADSGWTEVGTAELKASDYSSSGNTWAYTFNNLLKYDDQSTPYYFKINETEVKAYSTTYNEATATAPESGLNLTNELITRPVSVEKQWDDSNYQNGASLHYDINFTLTHNADTGANIGVPQTLTYSGTLTSDKSSATETITISNVPVYDKNGNVITYTATENGQQYGYKLETGYPQTENGTGDLPGVVTKYIFKNKLPVTYLSVKKEYDVNDKYHKYVNGTERDITFNVTRKVNNGNDEDVFTNQPLTYSTDPRQWITSNPVLVYNVNNQQYTYKVTEQTLKGYDTAYSYTYGESSNQTTTTDGTIPAEERTSGSPLEMTITNTQKTGDVKMQKIDYTYYKTHYGEQGYTDIPLNNAEFKLYVKDSNNQEIPVPVMYNNNGYYEFDKTTANTDEWKNDPNTANDPKKNLVESKQNGIIEIKNLPLNTYYLKETKAISAAYKQNPAEFSFVVDDEPEAAIYNALATVKNDHNADIYPIGGFITHENQWPKIGNEEEPRKLQLTKKDAVNGKGLPNATYYLLYLIPYEIKYPNKPKPYSEEDLSTYKSEAKNAIINSQGKFENVSEYWRIETEFQTGQDGTFATPIEVLKHGTYTVMEVQAPIGYELDNDGLDSITYKLANNATENGSDNLLITLDGTHYECDIIHKDPRKTATVDIYKQDKWENPLNGAEFELYYDPIYQYVPLSDYDYIFFTDNDYYKQGDEVLLDESGGGSQGLGAWGTVYATFYTDNTQVGDPIKLDTYWKNNEREHQKVYKVQPLANTNKVVFSNDTNLENSNTKKTVEINFTLGNGYYKTKNNSNIYEVNSNPWNYAKGSTNNQTVKYDTYGEYIYIKKTDLIGNDHDWDDLHIYFSDGTNIIGQGLYGYTVSETYKDSSNQEYLKIAVPAKATFFSINNGDKQNSNNDSVHFHKRDNIDIVHYAGYEITGSNNNYSIQICATGLETDDFSTSVSQQPAASVATTPLKIAKVTTGDDGLTSSVTILEPGTDNPTQNNTETDYVKVINNKVVLKKWGKYYWREKTAPGGYIVNKENLGHFTIDAEKADMTVYISTAGDTRKTGSATLTKVAKKATSNTAVGTLLGGAKFELHKESGDSAITLIRKTDGTYVVKPDSATLATLVGDYYKDGTSIAEYNEMETSSTAGETLGKFKVEGLEWGNYYFEEKSIPENTGYTHTNSNDMDTTNPQTPTPKPNKVSFTIGRNNCETGVDLICKDEAQKAKLKVTKNIDDLNVNAWGEPTFIFRIKQIGGYNNGTLEPIAENKQPVRTVELTFAGNTIKTNNVYTASTDDYDIEPGRYEVTEVSVSRYEFKSVDLTSESTIITDKIIANQNQTATFTIGANGSAEVVFENTLKYYDKFSQVECKVNNFNGCKGIRVEYKNAVSVIGNESTISKNTLDVYKIMSDGSEVKLDSTKSEDANVMNSITYAYVEKTNDDPRFGKDQQHDFSDDTTNNQLKITNPSRYTDGVYTLRASYQGLTCDFDIHFDSSNHVDKEYQKTVIFKADDNNMTYFDEAGGTSQYAFIFTMVKDPNDSNKYVVNNIKHNGQIVSDDDVNNVINNTNDEVLKVNEAYNGKKNFKCWKKDDTEQSSLVYSSDDSTVESILKLVTDNNNLDPIIYTAVLQDRPTTP